MSFRKIDMLADAFELKLASMPDKDSVHQAIVNVINNLKSDPHLKGINGISEQTSVSGAIGEKTLVYFQLVADQKMYNQLIAEPQRTNLINWLKPIVEQELSKLFHQYEFSVKIGIVI